MVWNKLRIESQSFRSAQSVRGAQAPSVLSATELEPKLWMNWRGGRPRDELANLTPVPPLHDWRGGWGRGRTTAAASPSLPLSIGWRGGQGERSIAPAREKSAQRNNN